MGRQWTPAMKKAARDRWAAKRAATVEIKKIENGEMKEKKVRPWVDGGPGSFQEAHMALRVALRRVQEEEKIFKAALAQMDSLRP